MPDLSNLSDDQLLALHQQATAAPSDDLSHLSDDELLKMHAAATAPTPPAPKSGVLDTLGAAGRGAVSGSTMGFGDELYGLVGGALNPMNSDKGFWDRYHQARDYARRKDSEAAAAHPIANTAGQLAGSIGTAFVPGMGALNAGKGAGVIEMAGRGALQGALAGSGEAKEFTDIPGAALSGAKTGAAVGGALGVAGKVGGAIVDAVKPARVASVLLNVPEDAVQRYIESPGAVNAARPRAELVQDFLDRAEALKNDVINGSQASRETLANEGQKISGNAIADIFDSHANDIAKRSEGVLSDEQAATVGWLKHMAGKYRSKIPEEMTNDLAGVFDRASGDAEEAAMHIGGPPDHYLESVRLPEGMSAQEALAAEADRSLSTNRVKDLVQEVQRGTQYEAAPGRMMDVDNLVRQRAGGEINTMLKGTSPAYAEQMKGVAQDTGLLNQVSDLAKSPQGFDNLLKRTQRGNTPHIMDSLNQFDARTGGGLIQELKDSAVKDAMNKGFTNGSRAVNAYATAGGAMGEKILGVPGRMAGAALGAATGATVDKFGGPIARGAVDTASKLQSMISSSDGLQKLGKFAGPLVDAAKRGNQSLAVTHYMLSQQDPEYSQMMMGNGQ